ncbi:MAG: glutathione S-transferase family protein [Nevskiales bacterium]|nr:glutathione S-transferase family protein [Nevskiales bacterium]
MYTLYGMTGSGNCYKPALLMRQLGIPYTWIEVDLLRGATHSPDFLALNPTGKVPVLQLPDGRCLSESNAMLCLLAEGTPLLPSERWARAEVMQWLFFEQYSHEPAIATVRFWVHYLGKAEAWRDRIRETRPKGYAALQRMELQLCRSDYLAGDAYSIADIALYAYTHVADQGGYRLGDFPRIEAWLRRVQRQPGYFAMADRP